MNWLERLTPVEASSEAAHTDAIFWGLMALAIAIILLVVGLIVGFSIRYRRGSNAPRGPLPDLMAREVEVGWTVATLMLALFIFWWAASAQFRQLIPPKDALEIHVVAKQWMWKTQHPSGAREINALHAPIGVPVKLVMTSQDVIHSFYVPAFRMKQDLIPGRYAQTWFKATKTGTFDLFCAQYCGLDHSRMVGQVIVLSQPDYAKWAEQQPNGDTLAQQGKAIYEALSCSGCHAPGATVRAPVLAGLYGRPVALASGAVVRADEDYLRDAIVLPQKDVVAGYQPVMPSYRTVLKEDDLVTLIAYLKSLPPTSGEAHP
jgi:cytochrome c oxidase subunit 2